MTATDFLRRSAGSNAAIQDGRTRTRAICVRDSASYGTAGPVMQPVLFGRFNLAARTEAVYVPEDA